MRDKQLTIQLLCLAADVHKRVKRHQKAAHLAVAPAAQQPDVIPLHRHILRRYGL